MKSGNDQAHAARQVLAGNFNGVLSTHSLEQAGHAFGSVVPCVLNQDGPPLPLLGQLSQHTENLHDAAARWTLDQVFFLNQPTRRSGR
jgi:putative heme iron utilization protein